ncbi:hypothetical protein CH373_06255 [Leptospira perolatii]|uniref:AraC-type arabinose-binding/dimerisation domain-containing protein n=1 Tax=Leptospira perolatii TaxID=2023191 RepID=A0A2M9ZNV4_9LEPT|nr:cupin domain-containing protein [Leptospira perolatii]PJZ70866.1 hypothetical protein CH360_04985 [Leptospira perolatii]PJZ73762.1 hypothetical protein CH373_06255 [Leptospira perolatii]
MALIIKKESALAIDKKGVAMRIYNNKDQYSGASVVYQETQKGHFEEFYHSKSHFIYYIIEGNGIWYIDEQAYDVSGGDLIIIPPNSKFYYKGALKQICIVSPSWEPESEHHVRDIDWS